MSQKQKKVDFKSIALFTPPNDNSYKETTAQNPPYFHIKNVTKAREHQPTPRKADNHWENTLFFCNFAGNKHLSYTKTYATGKPYCQLHHWRPPFQTYTKEWRNGKITFKYGAVQSRQHRRAAFYRNDRQRHNTVVARCPRGNFPQPLGHI